MRIKKLLVKFVCCVLMTLLTVFGLVSCKKDKKETVYTVKLSETTKEMTVGETFTLTATTDPVGGTVVWTSSQPSVATVEDGVVVAVSEGSVTITATCGKNDANCNITVSQPVATTYEVNFVSGDTTIKTLNVVEGEKATYTGAIPTQTATDEYEFEFVGWATTEGGELVNLATYAIESNTTFYAVFAESVREYTVTWNVEGATSTATFAYGATPVYEGATPTKEQAWPTVYTFVGWTNTIGGVKFDTMPIVTGDVTFYAVFEETTLQTDFTVNWKNGDVIIHTSIVYYGNVPTYTGETPVKEDTTEHSYEFVGWSATQGGEKLGELPEITADATFYAVFTETARKYTVTWNVEGETSTSKVAYGTAPAYTGATPVKADSAECSYKFVGWATTAEGEAVESFATITGDVTYYAVFAVDKVFEAPKFEGGKFMYSNADGQMFAPETLTPAGVTMTSVVIKTEGEADVTVYENNAWVKANLNLTAEQLQTNKVIAYKTETRLSNGARYTVDMEVYAGIIDELSDISNFFKTEGTVSDTSDIAIYGYYIVISDLGSATTDLSVATASGKTWAKPQGFCGVFDGLGHTLKFNLTGTYGLFGEQIGSCRVKNTAFIFSDNTTTHNGLLGCMVPCGAAVMENCYVEQTNNHYAKTSTFGVLGRPNGKLIIENSIIYGFNISQANGNGAEKISPQSKNAIVIHGRSNADALNFAENFVVQNDGLGNASRDYAYGEMNVDGFNNAYWTKENGIIRWKTFETITITWVDGETTIVETITKGSRAVTQQLHVPEKTDSTVYSGYWSDEANGTKEVAFGEKVLLNESVTYYAVYTSETREYTVTWNVAGATSETKVAYGTVPTYEGTPSKAQTADKVYTFAGWATTENGTASELTAVSADVTYYAVFTETARKYTVTWNVNGATTSEQVAYGVVPAFAGEAPTKATTVSTVYTFAGWATTENGTASEPTAVSADVTYYAIFTETARKYTVTWNVEGATASEQVAYGVVPQYEGTPAKAQTTEKVYTFAGWATTQNGAVSELAAVSTDVTYFAVFTESARKYTVTWNVEGKTTNTQVAYGTAPAYEGTPSKDGTAEKAYTFAGWAATQNGEIIATLPTVTGEVTYFAVFTETNNVYTITWNVEGATSTSQIAYGSVPAYFGEGPVKASTVSTVYTFAGWATTAGGEVVATLPTVTGEVTYYAVFTESVRQYTVTWNVEGVTATTKVNYNVAPQYEGTPAKAQTVAKVYTFAGWATTVDGEVVATLPVVTADATYYAVFTETAREYTVTWNINGETSTNQYAYGATPSHVNPVKAEDENYTYEFSHWSTTENGVACELATVSADATYFAVFTATEKSKVVTVAEAVLFSTNDNKVYFPATLDVAFDNVDSITSADGETTYYDGDAWLNSFALTDAQQSANAVGVYQAVVTVGASQYNVTVNSYTEVFDEFADFERFYKGSGTAVTVTGSYALANDIGSNSDRKDMCAEDLTLANNFNGYFDGLGHTVTFKIEATHKKQSGYYGGLFGRTVRGTIKNVKFNVNLRGSKGGAGVLGFECDTSGTPIKTYLENVNIYIYEYALWGNTGDANKYEQNVLFQSSGWNALSMKNMVIEVVTVTDKTSGALTSYNLLGKGGAVTVNNVYLIKHNTCYSTTPGNTNGSVTGIPSYDTLEELANAGKDMSGFTGVWTTTNGYPVFKTATTYSNVTTATKLYTVTWNIDGVTTTNSYEEGATPSHANPVKAEDENYTYTFSHWSTTENGEDCGEFAKVTGAITYYAVFTKTQKSAVVTVSEKVMYSTADDALYFPSTLALTMEDITSIKSVDKTTTYYNGTEWTMNFDLTETQIQANEIGSFNVIIASATTEYAVTINSYADVFTQFSDFELFYKGTGSTQDIYGSYALANDVGSTALATRPDMCASTLSVANNFLGTFDGMGHKVAFKIEATYNKAGTYYGGLFGRGLKGTVKNLNIDANLRGSKGGAGVLAYECDTSQTPIKTYIENVNIKINEYAYWGNAGDDYKNQQNVLFFSSGWGALTMTNVIVEVCATADKSNGAITTGYNLIGKGGAVTVNNVYFIKHSTNYDATTGNTNGAVTGIPTYADFTELANAGKDFSAFTGVWDTTGSYPVFGTVTVVYTNVGTAEVIKN